MYSAGKLDLGRWTGLWSRLGAQDDGLSTFAGLAAAYSEPDRAYHTADHIRDCLEQLDLFRDTARRADEVEAALWFHDAVYLPGRLDNEERSADLASTALHQSGIAPRVGERVVGLVLATRHLTTSAEPDAALVCDIDLSVLGRSPDLFDRFERQIRREYSAVPEPQYRIGRSQILRAFLNRPAIYQTGPFRECYEGQARANLARMLKELG